jgi:hypothetical protein
MYQKNTKNCPKFDISLVISAAIHPGNCSKVPFRCSKYKSMSSIQWCNQIFYVANYLRRKLQTPVFYYRHRSKSTGDSSRNMFQMLHSCLKDNSISSIEWCNQIFYILNYFRRKFQKTVFYYRNRSKSTDDSSKNMFQMFHSCPKYKSMSSIRFCHQISHNPNNVCKSLKILCRRLDLAFLQLSMNIVCDMENIMTPLDRAH